MTKNATKTCLCVIGLGLGVDVAGQVISDGTLGRAGAVTPGGGYTYDITPDYGRQVDANLFHSFSEFSIRSGEIANFSGPQSVERVISRVTGGNASDINGTLSSTISGSDVYLVNPSGVMFGPDAELDVQGSFHATTADYIDLADGGRFDASEPANSVLTTAPPSAFGFLGDIPAPISVNQSALEVPQGETISLIGGDIRITGQVSDNNLAAPSGRINVVSVASPGKVITGENGASLDPRLESFERLGSIEVSRPPEHEGHENLTTKGDPGGKVFIRGGALTIDRGAIQSSSTGDADHPGIGVDIAIEGDIKLLGVEANAEIESSSDGAGRAGDILISADELHMRGGDTDAWAANIGSRAFASGDGGNTRITTNSLRLTHGAWIGNVTRGGGKGGDLIVRTDDLVILGNSYFWNGTFGSSGNAGDIDITARNIVMNDGDLSVQSRPGDGEPQISGKGGDLRLKAENLQLLRGAQILATTETGGPAGSIHIDVGSILIKGVNDRGFPSGIFSSSWGSGSAGSIEVNAADLNMTDRARIRTDGFSSGDGGRIRIDADTIDVRNAAVISSSGAFVQGIANAGTIEIATQRLSMTGLVSADDPFNTDGTGIIAITRDGNGGNVTIKASDSVTLTQRASMGSSSFGAGPAGLFRVETPSLQLLDGSQIVNNAFGSGQGGDVVIDADTVKISGVNDEPFNDILGRSSLAPSAISAQTVIGGGDAGTIRISARSLEVLDGGLMSTATFGSGQGGVIELNTDQLVVAGENAVHREFLINRGIEEPSGARSTIGTTSLSNVLGSDTTGNAGLIAINTGDLVLRERGLISSGTTGPGYGGTVQISAENVHLSGDAGLEARSRSSLPAQGNAGNIRISALKSFESTNSTVLAQADGGKGGSIEITAEALTLERSSISSTVTGGKKNAGSVTLNVGELQAKNSSASSSTTDAASGDGGSVTVQGVKGEGAAARSVTWVGTGPKGFEGSLGTTAIRGAGGSIYVKADEIGLTDAVVSASVSGDEPGGSVTLRAPSLTLLGTEVTAETRGAGRAGNILLEVGRLVATDDSLVSSRSSATGADAGDGGEVTIRGLFSPAQTVVLQSRSALETSAVDGDGGNIDIFTRDLFMGDGARIAAESEGFGAAGNIDIDFLDYFLMQGSTVSTDSRISDGGDIDIDGGYIMFLRDDSAITTSVGTGEGTGGNISIQSRFVILDASAILANAFGGPGGNIFIFADGFIPSADSIVEAIGKQSQIPGRIEILAPDTDFIQSLAPLPEEFEDPGSRLGDRCSVRRDVDQSTFGMAVRDGLPLGPEAFLLSTGMRSESFEFQGNVLDSESLQVDPRLVADASLIQTVCQ